MRLKNIIFDANSARATLMKEYLLDSFYMYDVDAFGVEDEKRLVGFLRDNHAHVLFASIFHNIEYTSTPSGFFPEAGIGYEVLDRLLTLPPSFPILLHTTNTQFINYYPCGALKDKGWRAVEAVKALDDLDQLYSQWFMVARRLILDTATPLPDSVNKVLTQAVRESGSPS